MSYAFPAKFSLYSSSTCFILFAKVNTVSDYVSLQRIMQEIPSDRKLSFIIAENPDLVANYTLCHDFRPWETVLQQAETKSLGMSPKVEISHINNVTV